MSERPRQLVLDLPVEARLGIEDFLVSPSNEDAYAQIECWPDWPGPLLHLRGPSGSGKSHLAAIWATSAGAVTIAARAVGLDRVPEIASKAALVLEDLDRGPLDEGALFHLVNLTRERGTPILVTSERTVDLCGIATPDLLSRLRLAASVELGPPDDALLRAVLIKLLLDRQLVVDIGVVDYVANRIERSIARAAAIVAELDRDTLSRGRRITRATASDVLSRHPELSE